MIKIILLPPTPLPSGELRGSIAYSLLSFTKKALLRSNRTMSEQEQVDPFFFGLKLSSQRKFTLCKDFHSYVLTSLQDLLYLYKEVRFENKTIFLFVDTMMNIWSTPGIYRGLYPIKPSETFQKRQQSDGMEQSCQR